MKKYKYRIKNKYGLHIILLIGYVFLIACGLWLTYDVGRLEDLIAQAQKNRQGVYALPVQKAIEI